LLPLRDDLPTRRFPIVTVVIIVLNAVVFLVELLLQINGSLDAFFMSWGVIPYEITHGLGLHAILTLFTSMFLHGGFMHILGNMLYLWIFGNNIEDSMGHARFVLFYALSGVAAALCQFVYDPASELPMVGASGAVSGVLGAYLLLFPYARIKTLIFIFIFITTVELPAIVLLTIWFFMQVLFSHTQGVAWFAHIGGFLFGLITIRLFTLGKARARPARR